jgi:hypothetical protein
MEWRRCPVPMPDTDVSPQEMLEKIECLLLNMMQENMMQLGTLCALDKPRKYTMLYDAPSSTCFEQSRVATVLNRVMVLARCYLQLVQGKITAQRELFYTLRNSFSDVRRVRGLDCSRAILVSPLGS